MFSHFYKEVSLDSSSFKTGSKDRPTFYFNTFMDDMDYICVSKVILPTTYYVFSSPSYVSCTIGGSVVSWAAGNYTPDEWIAVVQPQVAGLTITYSLITSKLTFSKAGAFSIVFGATENAYELLGFPAGTTSGTNTIVAPFIADFSGPNYCVLHTRMASVFNGSSIYFSETTEDASLDRMKMIPIDENRNSLVIYRNEREEYFEWFDTQSRNLEFYFTLGTRKETMAFNGAAFQIVLSGQTSPTANYEKNTDNVRSYFRSS